MAVNTELAKKVFIQISLHPETHDQQVVTDGLEYLEDGSPCGTTACVAGWTCAFAGLLEERTDWDGVPYLVVPGEFGDDWFGKSADALGITRRMADVLFNEELPEDVARETVRLLAVDGGSQGAAESFLRSEGYDIPRRDYTAL